MAIYFDGFDDKMLSFYSESGRVGMLAYPVANKSVNAAASKSPTFWVLYAMCRATWWACSWAAMWSASLPVSHPRPATAA